MLDLGKQFLFRLLLCLSVVLLAAKLYSSTDYPLIFSTYIFELAIIALLFISEIFISRSLKSPFLRFLSKSFFFVAMLLHSMLSLLLSMYLDDALERELSFSRIDFGVISVFFTDILPLADLLLIFIFLLIVLIVASLLKYSFVLSRRVLLAVAILTIFVIALVPKTFREHFTSPYVHTVKTFFAKRIITVANTPVEKLKLDLSSQKLFAPEVFNSIKYKRIYVFVMESVMLKNFADDMKARPESFLGRMKSKSHFYENYYTTNQDSRTAITAMLSSIVVPYEAYVKKGEVPPYYKEILRRENLISGFNKSGFKTSFLISSLETPTVGQVYPWQNNFNIKSFDSNGKYLCLHILKNQRGCEDMAISDQFLSVAIQDSKQFIFQEFVFGHGARYEKLSKKTRIQYYNDYLGYVYQKLREQNLTRDSLFVLVGDHGYRRKSKMKKMGKYKVPLVFIAEDLKEQHNKSLQSHLHFSSLLLRVATNQNASKPPLMNDTYVIGSTGTGLINYIDKERNFFTIESIDSPRLVTSVGLDEQRVGSQLEAFIRYREDFADTYGTPYSQPIVR